ncbi:unnamed protein product [Ilex paraguariensis]|uniref:Uncharacterized protein n=1 Tax=Ilex paraguariensis TaxID=185542 RepID=A0ABC8QYK4_9AQUA
MNGPLQFGAWLRALASRFLQSTTGHKVNEEGKRKEIETLIPMNKGNIGVSIEVDIPLESGSSLKDPRGGFKGPKFVDEMEGVLEECSSQSGLVTDKVA